MNILHGDANDILLRREQLLELALEFSHTGAWDLELSDQTAHRTVEHDRIFGYEALLPEWSFSIFLDHVLPEYRNEVQRLFHQAITGQTDWSFECQIRRIDGAIRWITVSGKHIRNSNGVPCRLAGIVRDITDLKAAEADRNRLIKIIEEATDYIGLADLQGNLLFHNVAARKMLGYSDDLDFSTLRIEDIHPLWASKLVLHEGIPTALRIGAWSHETAILHKDGHEIPVSQILLLHRDESGNPEFLSTIMRDISERIRYEVALKNSLSLLHSTLEATADAILVVDLNNAWSLYNQKFIDMWHITDDIVRAKDDNAALQYVLNQLVDAEDFLKKVRELYATPKERSFDVLNFKNGTIVERFSNPQFNGGDVVGRVWSFRDVTRKRELERKIYTMAFYDSLTKLPNRQLLNDRLDQSLEMIRRNGFYGALMFLDLDNFKPLNDQYGHAAGDVLLAEAANRLKKCLRGVDTVARFGGDEFVVLISDMGIDKESSIYLSKTIAEKIRIALAVPFQIAIKNDRMQESVIEHHCTVSIGVVLFKSTSGSKGDIIKWADLAMYHAKEAGRNSISFYDPAEMLGN